MIKDKKNVLVIGYGSIGQRHTQVLSKLNITVHVFSKRNIDYDFKFNSLIEAMANISYDYIVIANKTSEHYSTVNELIELNFKGILLIEKPIFEKYKTFETKSFSNIFVAYNLRFYPVIQELRKHISNQKILSVNAYAGQYLPQWRPNTDYRNSYSSKKSEGGGVLLDLSHEIDYLNWLLGGTEEVMAVGGKFSNLEIDTDDLYHISLKTKKCELVQLELNYIDKVLRRYVIINTEKHTYRADLISSTLEIDGNCTHYESYRNFSYEIQHQSLIKNDFSMLCKHEDALEVMKICDAIKTSNINKTWIKIK